MQNGTLEAPTPERTLELDDEMRKVLAAEAKWFCASIGDQIEHAPAGKHGRGTVVLRREAERISLAIALCAAVENGALNAPDLPQIVEMVSDTVREYRDELHHYGEGLQQFIIRGEDPWNVGNVVDRDRARNIREYHQQIAEVKEQIARCERFLSRVA
jgi:hypothetical protein